MDSHTPKVECDQILADSSEHGDHALEDQRIGYLSLPPEIRNQIMRLALVPGQIHIRPPIIAKRNSQYLAMQVGVLPKSFFLIKKTILKKASTFVHWIRPGLSYPLEEAESTMAESGCQLLATCCQVYLEGHGWFYSLNTFYIPRGPLLHTIEYFDKLQPSHRALMKTIGIRFGLQDLTSTVLEAVDRRGKGWGLDPRGKHRMATRKWTWLALKTVEATWKAKLVWIRSWTGLERVTLESAHGMLELKGRWLQRTIKDSFDDDTGYGRHGYEGCSREVAAFMLATSRRVRDRLSTGLYSSWECRKKALLSGNLLLDSDLNPGDHSPQDF